MQRSSYWMFALFCVSFAFHYFMISDYNIGGPDPIYYRTVARNIAEGHGAVHWARLFLHEGFLGEPGSPLPADLWWMPIPSRILVLEFLLGGEGVATNLVLGALVAPLCYRLAYLLGVGNKERIYAGLLAAFSPSICVNTDSSILAILLGGCAFCFYLQSNKNSSILWLGVTCALFSLTRNDGFFVGIIFSGVLLVQASKVRAAYLLPAFSSVGAYVAWCLRNIYVAGFDSWRNAKFVVSNAVDFRDVWVGVGDLVPISFWGRVEFIASYYDIVLDMWLFQSRIVIFPFVLWGVWKHRQDVGLVMLIAWVVFPVFVVGSALSTALNGTILKTAAYVLPIVYVLAASAFARLDTAKIVLVLWVGLALYWGKVQERGLVHYECTYQPVTTSPISEEWYCRSESWLDPRVRNEPLNKRKSLYERVGIR